MHITRDFITCYSCFYYSSKLKDALSYLRQFLATEKSYKRNYSQTFFLKIKIEHISGSVVSSFIQLVFIVCQVEGYQNILKLGCRSLAFISKKAFSKNKKSSGNTFLGWFSVWLLKKNHCYLLLPDQMLPGCLCFGRYWTICIL